MAEHRNEPGTLVRSKAGRDKGRLYVMIQESGEYLYLADGKYRKLEDPKRKNKKHVQVERRADENLKRKLADGERVTDEEVKRFIQCCKREDQVARR